MAHARYYPSRTIFHSDSLVFGSGKETLVCINRDLIPIIIEYLSTRGLYKTTYFKSQGSQYYTLPDDSDFNVIRNIISEAVFQLQLGFDMALCDDLSATIASLNQSLAGINNSIQLQTQAILASTCCEETEGGNPDPQDDSEACVTPQGFENWSEFNTYGCRAANWIVDKLIVGGAQLGRSWFIHSGDFQNPSSQYLESVTQVFQRISRYQPSMIPFDWLLNLSDQNKTAIKTKMTNLYMSFRADRYIRAPETATIDEVISDWYDAALHYTDYILDNKEAIIQDFYESLTATDLLDRVDYMLSLAYAYADAQSTGQLGLELVREIMESLFDVGVTMLPFQKSPTLNSYTTGIFDCTGTRGECCPTIALLVGQHTGQDQYTSVYQSGFNRVDLINNATDVLETCGVTLQWVPPSIISGDYDSYEIYDDNNDFDSEVVGHQVGQICIRRIVYKSSVPFVIEVGANECS